MTALANWLPDPTCCNTDNPFHLCPNCWATYRDNSLYAPRPSFFGVGNQRLTETEKQDFLPLPVLNFAEEQQPRVHQPIANVLEGALLLPNTMEQVVAARRAEQVK